MKLSFYEHLQELRERLIVCLITTGAAAVFSYFFAERLIPYLVKPVGRLVFIQPYEAFAAYWKLALFCGILLSLPVWLYQMGIFILAGLTPKEKRSVLLFGPLFLLFFVLGAVFAYLVVVPFGIKFFLNFGRNYFQPLITVSSYLSFLGTMLLAFGVIFEMPVIIIMLAKLGLVTADGLRRNRRYVILAIFIIAAIMTPPDVFTQFMLALPLLLLYEISILGSSLFSFCSKQKP